MEFAFIDILPKDRRGLCAWEPVRDRLAGLLFRPSSKKTVSLNQLQLSARQILLPLSRSQWETLKPETRLKVYGYVEKRAGRLGSRLLAFNRHLRLLTLPYQASGVRAVRGDFFIPALALALVENEFYRGERERLWLAGDFPGLVSLIGLIGRMGIMVAVQTAHPSRLEPITHRLMYEEGIAVSLGSFNPGGWGNRDVVMIFDPAYLPFVPTKARKGEVLVIDLTDDSAFHAPRLEAELQEQGIDASLKVTAPLLEAWLWIQPCGSSEISGVGEADQPGETSINPIGNHHRLGTANLLSAAREAAFLISRFKQKGYELGLWRFFLDKDFRALYNTTQGKGAVG